LEFRGAHFGPQSLGKGPPAHGRIETRERSLAEPGTSARQCTAQPQRSVTGSGDSHQFGLGAYRSAPDAGANRRYDSPPSTVLTVSLGAASMDASAASAGGASAGGGNSGSGGSLAVSSSWFAH